MSVRPIFWVALALAALTLFAVKMDKLKQLLVGEEGLRLKVYKDTGGAWTVGYGHKILPGDGLYPYGTRKEITQAEADKLFANDTRTATTAVRSSVKYPLNENMFAALSSLAYNIGNTAFRESTLVKKLNAGDVAGAANEFLRWNQDNGKVDPVLVARRAREKAIFLS